MIVKNADSEGLYSCVEHIMSDKAAIFPTDTVYGIGALIGKQVTVDLIFELKKRPREVPLAVLAANPEQLKPLVKKWDGFMDKVADKFWPGALTIVVEKNPDFHIDLGGDNQTIGIRVPDCTFTLKLLENTGPLATSSANIHTDPICEDLMQIKQSFSDKDILVIYDGELKNIASTVADLRNEVLILREGTVSLDDILALK
jgi:L-threonylcarbamoyladenylate synthase